MRILVTLAHHLSDCIGIGITWFFSLVLLPVLICLLIMDRLEICSYSVSSEILALFPGECARRIRRLWYQNTLKKCGKNICVEWMAVIRNKESEIGENVWIGPFCWVCRVRIGNNTMLGGHVNVLSGKNQHSFSKQDQPIRDQGGTHIFVEIGENCWIGNRAIVMADISEGSIVTAGAVVNKVFPSQTVIGGVPANIISLRENLI